MDKPRLSEKQWEVVLDSDAPINIADGPVRSGKTFAKIFRFGEYCITGPPGDLVLTGKTERVVRRNVIGPLIEMFGKRVRYNQGQGEVYFASRTLHVIGANDVRAEEKLRGVTLAGGYCNELTLHPETFFDQLIARCSVTGAQIFADTNPDNPRHWLYTRFLTNAEAASEVKRFQFRLDDNPALSEEYKARLKRLYTGLWRKRMVDGLWVQAEGAIYDMLDESRHVVDILPAMVQYIVACDYGTANDFVALLISVGIDNRLYVIDEWRHASRKAMRQMTDAEYSKALQAWLAEWNVIPRWLFVDPSAASFILQLRRDRVPNVTPADNSVIDGIRDVSTLLSTDHLKIHRRCEGLLSEMQSYVWDEKAQLIGEDKPLKQNDHGPDALRYGCRGTMHIWRRWLRAERKAA